MSVILASSAPASETSAPTGYRSSGASPPDVFTVHLLGPGKVGRAFLKLVEGTHCRVVGVTDSTGTATSRDGLNPAEIIYHKNRGGSLRDYPGGAHLPLPVALNLVKADVVIDAAPTRMAQPRVALERAFAALRSGSSLAMAGKDALAHGAQRLLSDEYGDRVGMDAALGGTGASLQRELKTLQKECREIAVVGNATTTLLLSCVEKGLGFEAALDEARRRGLLESDPGDDLDGSDAAAKLAAVVRAVFLEDVDPGAIEKQHFRDLDPGRIRERSARGTTTRLVGRALRGGPLRVAYEEVDAGSPLAVPPDRLAYLYPLGGGAVRVFVGSGVGPEATARALWQDALRLASAKGGAR